MVVSAAAVAADGSGAGAAVSVLFEEHAPAVSAAAPMMPALRIVRMSIVPPMWARAVPWANVRISELEQKLSQMTVDRVDQPGAPPLTWQAPSASSWCEPWHPRFP